MSETFRMSDAAKAAVAKSYNLMSDHYGDVPFWDRYGQHIVERLALAPGSMVLDVGCGAGASALPAAQAVGPQGHVIGVDLSDGLLELARGRAHAHGLDNLTFLNQDMTALPYPDVQFDAVISGFSIFFPDDLPGFVSELWRMVKPGGRLAVATWAPPIFEPLDTLLRICALAELPHLRRSPSNMHQVASPHQLAQILREGGAENVVADVEYDCQALSHPDDWWTMAMGSGLRRIIASMSDEAARRVRERMSNWIHINRASHVASSVVYGIATKPPA